MGTQQKIAKSILKGERKRVWGHRSKMTPGVNPQHPLNGGVRRKEREVTCVGERKKAQLIHRPVNPRSRGRHWSVYF